MPAAPQIFDIARNWGLPRGTVRISITGTHLATVTAVGFSGSGVSAVLVGTPFWHALEAIVSIAGDAAPGPRAVVLVSDSLGVRASVSTSAVFHVLTSSAGSGVGVGSHLI